MVILHIFWQKMASRRIVVPAKFAASPFTIISFSLFLVKGKEACLTKKD